MGASNPLPIIRVRRHHRKKQHARSTVNYFTTKQPRMVEPPIVVVPSATVTRLGLHFGNEETSGFARKRVSKHPEWLLDDDNSVDWSKFRGSVLDVSYATLPTLHPIATGAPNFTRLTVLCLRESGVVDIELLRPCAMLVHLDLSSNEIVHLVGGGFWASFRDLLVLLLHGNKVRGAPQQHGRLP